MSDKTLYELIIEALNEARILESACERSDQDNMLFVAQRLSGAPFSFVKEVYDKMKAKELGI